MSIKPETTASSLCDVYILYKSAPYSPIQWQVLGLHTNVHVCMCVYPKLITLELTDIPESWYKTIQFKALCSFYFLISYH